MKFISLTIFTLITFSTSLYSQTFNNVEKSKKYKLTVTGLPTDFEDEEFDPEEAELYNEGYDSEVLDEYDIPAVVDTPREKTKELNNKQPLDNLPKKNQALKE